MLCSGLAIEEVKFKTPIFIDGIKFMSMNHEGLVTNDGIAMMWETFSWRESEQIANELMTMEFITPRKKRK